VIITREGHAFECQSLAVISSIRRRGVLLLLVSVPDGSRSLIPATWTNWDAGHAGSSPPHRDDGTVMRCLGRLDDLLHLRKVVDALRGRHVESAPHEESSHAIEPGLSRPARSSTELLSSSPVADGMAPVRRSLAHRGA
jgi:hypothetical protein